MTIWKKKQLPVQLNHLLNFSKLYKYQQYDNALCLYAVIGCNIPGFEPATACLCSTEFKPLVQDDQWRV